MDADEQALRAASFGAVAQSYAQHRPGYPEEAVEWLVGSSPGLVLELGAGTGKLTQGLVSLGHDVMASDPSRDMLAQLRQAAPGAHRVVGKAEHIPLPSSSVDVVAAAQAFHWFDLDRALPEIARVLRPGGVLALAWNTADQKVPWVKKVFSLIGLGDSDVGKDPVEDSDLFSTSERKVVRHWQVLDRPALLGFCSSQSLFATKSEHERRELLDQIGAIYDSYGRGPDGMMLPWTCYCYRARVTGFARERTVEREFNDPGSLGDDLGDDGLLIDFR